MKRQAHVDGFGLFLVGVNVLERGARELSRELVKSSISLQKLERVVLEFRLLERVLRAPFVEQLPRPLWCFPDKGIR